MTWKQAQEFCAWLTKRFEKTELQRFGEGWRFMLPTEAQWIRAAFGDLDASRYPWGNDAPDISHAVFARAEGPEAGRRKASAQAEISGVSRSSAGSSCRA